MRKDLMDIWILKMDLKKWIGLFGFWKWIQSKRIKKNGLMD